MATLNFDSRKQYSRIFAQGSFPLSITGSAFQTTRIVAHTLGYTPMCKVWFTNHAGLICPASPLVFADMGFTDFKSATGSYGCWYWANTTQLSVTFDRFTNGGGTDKTTVWYRIYYDAVD